MTDCPRFAPMIGSRRGELPPPEAAALAAHLEGCTLCQARSSDLAATDGMVSEALLRAANSRDFSTFADEVMEKAGIRDAAAAPARGGGLLAWFRHHRAATAAGLVPLLAALAAIVYLRLEGGPGPVAMLEFTSEGEATTVLQTADGPVVLLDGDDGT